MVSDFRPTTETSEADEPEPTEEAAEPVAPTPPEPHAAVSEPPSPDAEVAAEPASPAKKIRGGELTAGNVDQVVEDLFHELSAGVDEASRRESEPRAERESPQGEPGSTPESSDEAAAAAPTDSSSESAESSAAPEPAETVATPEPASATEAAPARDLDAAGTAVERAESPAAAPDSDAASSGMPKWLIPAVAAAVLIVVGVAAWMIFGGSSAEHGTAVPASITRPVKPEPSPVDTSVVPFSASSATPDSVPGIVEANDAVLAEPDGGAGVESVPASTEAKAPGATDSRGAAGSNTANRAAENSPGRGTPDSGNRPAETGAAPEPAPAKKKEEPKPTKVAAARTQSPSTPKTAPKTTAKPPAKPAVRPAVESAPAETPEKVAANNDADSDRDALASAAAGSAAAAPKRSSDEAVEPASAAVSETETAAPIVAQPEPEPAPPAPPRATRGQLMALSDVDQPPFPVHKPAPTYDAFARKLKQQGEVVLRLLVNEKGRVADVEFEKRIPNSRLNDAAAKATEEWIYRPAYVDDIPVQVWITEKIIFKL